MFNKNFKARLRVLKFFKTPKNISGRIVFMVVIDGSQEGQSVFYN